MSACDCNGPLFGFDHTRTGVVDLAGCDMVVASCSLISEHEKGSVWFDAWPSTVRTRIKLMVDDWIARNPQRDLVLVSTGHGPDICFLILHHRAKP